MRQNQFIYTIIILVIISFYSCENSSNEQNKKLHEYNNVNLKVNAASESEDYYPLIEDCFRKGKNQNLKFITGHLFTKTGPFHNITDTIEKALNDIIENNYIKNTPFLFTKQDSIELSNIGINVLVKDETWLEFQFNGSTFFSIHDITYPKISTGDTLLIGYFDKYNDHEAAIYYYVKVK